MNFDLATNLSHTIDTISSSYVTDISSRTIEQVTPLAMIGVTLSFVFYGVAIIVGMVQRPVMEFLWKSIVIGMILAVALAGGMYQSSIQDAIITTPDALATALIADPATETTAASMIDVAAGQGFSKASDAFAKAHVFTGEIVYAFFGLIILCATALLVIIGLSWLLLAKVVLALLVGIGPLFILSLIWKPLRQFFAMWFAQVVTFTLLIVMIAAIFGLMTAIFNNYMRQLEFDGAMNAAAAIGSVMILSGVTCLIMWQLPRIASSLGGGLTVGFWHEIQGIASMGRAGVSGGRVMVNNPVTRVAGRGVAIAAVAGGSAVASGARAAAGYFKGRRA